MKHRVLVLLTIILVAFQNCNSPQNQKLTIATAANMQFAMDDLIQSFSKTSGIECEVIISSSGKITAQIYEGAPFDIFLSADMKYPEELYNQGLTTEPPNIYAFGTLVIWSTLDGINPSIEMLDENQVKHIAIANPRTAPYGKAAVETLTHYGVYDVVKDKLVFGESIAQTNQFIMSGAADIGFTSKSVVLSPNNSKTGRWKDIDPGVYTPIAQGAVIIKSTDHLRSSEKFLEFMFSEKGKEILHKFGYSVKGD